MVLNGQQSLLERRHQMLLDTFLAVLNRIYDSLFAHIHRLKFLPAYSENIHFKQRILGVFLAYIQANKNPLNFFRLQKKGKLKKAKVVWLAEVTFELPTLSLLSNTAPGFFALRRFLQANCPE